MLSNIFGVRKKVTGVIGGLCFLLFLSQEAFSAEELDKNKYCPLKSQADVVGAAFSLKDQTFLYCEYYFIDPTNQITRVEYTDAQQQTIATKEVDYSLSEFAPNVIQDDLRHGERRVAQYDREKQQYRLEYRPPNSDSDIIEQAWIKGRDNLVVDAGFDRAIRSQWDKLLQGKRARFVFAAPPSLTSFSLVVKKKKPSRCNIAADSNKVCLLVQSSSTLVNWFIQPIALTYDKASRKLLSFAGEVNIASPTGASQKAMIHYRYAVK